MNRRDTALIAHLDAIEARITSRFDRVDAHFDARFDRADARFDRVDAAIEQIRQDIVGMKIDHATHRHEGEE